MLRVILEWHENGFPFAKDSWDEPVRALGPPMILLNGTSQLQSACVGADEAASAHSAS
jgi:hypothetical protein